MSKYLDAYTALSSSSSRSQVAAVLQSITDAPPLTIDDAKRRDLIQVIIDDLAKPNSNSSKRRLSSKDAPPALQAVKSLGKNPAGSEIISTPANLSALLSLYHTYKDVPDASNEALRCVANALLLVDHARVTLIEKQVGGGDFAVELLEKSTVPERIFLASRILFLSTVSMSSAATFIRSLVEAKSPSIIELIGNKLDLLSRAILSGAKFSREAMTDLLKFTFNLLLHYPKLVDDPDSNETKVMGDCWSDRLDGILLPLLRAFNTLPPSFPAPLTAPMTHVIHALITIPVSSSLRTLWLPPAKISPSSTPKPVGSSESSSSQTSTSKASRSSSSSRAGSPTTGPAKDLKPGAFDRAWSALSAGRRSLSRSSSPHTSSTPVDVLLRAYDLLDVSLNHYMPDVIDPDDVSVRQRCMREMDQSLDDVMAPLVVLLTKLCQADEGSRTRMRQWLLPEDLDRTSPLEGRADLLGRLLRSLASVHHAKLKNATGEMLYAICDSDGSTLASYVGYGNVAGFLFNKGIMSAPPPPAGSSASAPTATADGVPINPITGVAEKPAPEIEMTDEEKEREAEKLFVLFDRLEKSGAIPKESNPIRQAIQQGKLG
ncbi:guanine nucleotide exchange factor [Ganoderma leucocontextum]|nr:guanine nucleotide exchange factor [Ganoderma leucocontextum]